MEDNFSAKFIEYLEQKNIQGLRQIPKSDLHNHSPLGFYLKKFSNYLSVKIPLPNEKMSLNQFETYITVNLTPYFKIRNCFEYAISECFLQAKSDGIKKLRMSTSLAHVKKYNDSPIELGEMLIKMHSQYAKEIDYLPEFGMRRERGSGYHRKNAFIAIESGLYKSLDLTGDEQSTKIGDYKEIFKYAKNNKLTLKAHVGETSKPDEIIRAVEELELDEVQHGISASKDRKVMQWLADNKIILNICPTSNVRLKRVRNFKEHPINILYRNGVLVTINSDDIAIFGKSVSEEYLNLFLSNNLTSKELDFIRIFGLRNNLKK